VIELRRLSRHFQVGEQTVKALQEIDLAIPAGDYVAIMGPSGSGKSTLLHLLSGLDRPSTGRVSWPGLGGDPTARPGLIGVVFQGPSLLPPLDVAENVALPLVLAGVAEDEAHRRALAALEQTDTAGLSRRLPEELSGGQAQRVAVARVLAMTPRLILADEPTGQLDAGHRDQIIKVLLAVAEQQNAVRGTDTGNADAVGHGTVNGAAGWSFRVTLIDGSPDRFSITIWQDGTTSETAPTYRTNSTALGSGSIAVH